jgi:hypothetical protein
VTAGTQRRLSIYNSAGVGGSIGGSSFPLTQSSRSALDHSMTNTPWLPRTAPRSVTRLKAKRTRWSRSTSLKVDSGCALARVRSHRCRNRRCESAACQQLAFQCGEEALAHCVVVGVTDRPRPGWRSSATSRGGTIPPAAILASATYPDCLRDADTQGNPNDLSDKQSTKPGHSNSLHSCLAPALGRGSPRAVEAWPPSPWGAA